MRLYNKFCKSPGHRVPKIVEKIDRGPLMVQCTIQPPNCTRFRNWSPALMIQVSCVRQTFNKVDQEQVVVW